MSLSESKLQALLKKVKAPKGKYDLDQVEDGIEVEMEHCCDESYKSVVKDEEGALKIALAHLDEMPDYYERLEEMEEEGKKVNKKKALAALRKKSED